MWLLRDVAWAGDICSAGEGRVGKGVEDERDEKRERNGKQQEEEWWEAKGNEGPGRDGEGGRGCDGCDGASEFESERAGEVEERYEGEGERVHVYVTKIVERKQIKKKETYPNSFAYSLTPADT